MSLHKCADCGVKVRDWWICRKCARRRKARNFFDGLGGCLLALLGIAIASILGPCIPWGGGE